MRYSKPKTLGWVAIANIQRGPNPKSGIVLEVAHGAATPAAYEADE
jgi:hypothetical protein